MQRKDRNHNDRFESGQSPDVGRPPRNHQCIALNDTASKQFNSSGPSDFGTLASRDLGGPVRSNGLERSRSDRADGRITRPRWDDISVWVPNTAGRGDQHPPLDRRKTSTLPGQSTTTLPPPTTTTTTTESSRQSLGSKLFSAASSKLASVWKRRPTKFRWKFSTSRNTIANDEPWTAQPPIQEDQKSASLTICRKCRGRTVNNQSFNRSFAAASVTPTTTTRTAATAPATLPTVKRDLETDSGYLIGRATSNSPNDVISCRTLPSTSPDEATGAEDNERDRELVEHRDVPRSGSGPSADCDVVGVKGTHHPEDLLSWKLSLMDRAEGRETSSTSWVGGGNSSSEDDEDDDCKADTTSHDVGNHSSRAGFSFESYFERALEKPVSPTTMTTQGNGDAPAADVEELFEAKLDELLRTSCDLKTDQLPRLCVDNNDHQQCTPLCNNNVADHKPESTHKPSDDEQPTDRVCPPSAVTHPLCDNANSSDVERRSSESLLTSATSASTGVGVTAAMVHKSFEPADVDGPAIRRSSSADIVSVPHRDDDGDNHGKVGSIDDDRIRSKSVPSAAGKPLLRDRDPLKTERRCATEQPRDPSIQTQSLPASFRRHCDVTFSPATGDESDNDRRTLPWKKLRTAVNDGVVELIDDLLAMLKEADGRTTSDLRRADVDRLRRRLLRNVRTALWTDSDLVGGPVDAMRDRDGGRDRYRYRDRDDDGDELQRLRKFVNALLDSSEEDNDICRITDIKKYVMTCLPVQEGGDDDDAGYFPRRHRQPRISNDIREINVFVLRQGVSIDGLHVSVAGRNDLPVHVTQDSRE